MHDRETRKPTLFVRRPAPATAAVTASSVRVEPTRRTDALDVVHELPLAGWKCDRLFLLPRSRG